MLHLVLHMDINETILIGDEAGGDSFEQCIQKILAKSAFVQCPTDIDTATYTANYNGTSTGIEIEHNETMLSQKQRMATSKVIPTHWWDGSSIDREIPPSSQQQQQTSSFLSPPSSSSTTTLPSLATLNSMVLPVPLWTQWEWPPNFSCPYYRTKNKKLSHTFTHHDGSIYHPLYQLLYHTLHPYRWYNTITAGTDSNDTSKNEMTMTNAISVNSYDVDKTKMILAQMLPSFFDTLIQLNEWSTSSSSLSSSISHITIVLRTFGTDLYHVMDAITQLFLQGQHPEYKHVQQQQGLPNINIPSPPYRIVNGQWIRSNNGTASAPSSSSSSSSSSNDRAEPDTNYEYQLMDDDGNIIASGDDNVVEWIHTLHLQNTNHSSKETKITICGIQDDYEHWSKHYCVPWAGKPIWKLVPPSSTNRAKIPNQNKESSEIHYHHVLFDDNIHNLEHNSIACVREEIKVEQDNIGKISKHDNNNDVSSSSSNAHVCRQQRRLFRTLSGAETLEEQGIHLIRVPTIEPILNRRWFIEQIETLINDKILANI